MTPDPETQLLDRIPTGLFIDGRWEHSSRTFEVHDPSTGAVLAHVADATPADGVRALDAAVAAQDSWAATAPRRRSEILRRAWELVQERAEDLALLMTLEMGKPLAASRQEVAYGGEFLRWFSEEAVRIDGRYTPAPEGTGHLLVTHRPVGPSFVITPWNFPLAMATRKIAPALAAGCTVVLKPAQGTPLTSLLLCALLEEAGVPAGVVNAVPSLASRELSARIIEDPRLRKLSFTGSTGVGRRLMEQAAEGILRTSMELGGNAPFLVFEDADLDRAVEGAMAAKFRNIGQACTAANRFLVQETVAEEFLERITARVEALPIGRGTEDGVEIGPLIDESAVASMERLVQDAVGRGARLRSGGRRRPGPGSFFPPTVVADVPPGSALLTEEIFGPVLAITTFATEEEAVRLAHDTDYGLVSYVYTQDLDRGMRMIDRLDTGMMGLNSGVVSNAAAPFGGVKHSGIGREGGHEGVHEYLSTKYTVIPTT